MKFEIINVGNALLVARDKLLVSDFSRIKRWKLSSRIRELSLKNSCPESKWRESHFYIEIEAKWTVRLSTILVLNQPISWLNFYTARNILFNLWISQLLLIFVSCCSQTKGYIRNWIWPSIFFPKLLKRKRTFCSLASQ